MNQLVTIEQQPEYTTLTKQLEALLPQFEELMGASGLPPERVVRTVMWSIQKNPKLLECDRQSIINAAMTAAVLGLEVDGVTGQGYLIPFGGQAVFVPGYKGYNTMAARSGFTINAAVVREGDEFEWSEGSNGFVKHKKKLGNKGRIIAAWAVAEAKTRPPIISILSIDEIMLVKAKSPGARKKDSPWNDATGPGFVAMCEKTARRRLARGMPLNVFQMGATIDEALEERGLASHIEPGKGVVIEGEASPLTPRQEDPPAEEDLAEVKFDIVKSDSATRTAKNIQEWKGAIQMGLATMTSPAQAEAFRDRNEEVFNKLFATHRRDVEEVIASIQDTIRALAGKEGSDVR